MQDAVNRANTVKICLEALKFATSIEDGYIITYVVHPLGSLTYDDDNHIPQSVNVRSQIVKVRILPEHPLLLACMLHLYLVTYRCLLVHREAV